MWHIYGHLFTLVDLKEGKCKVVKFYYYFIDWAENSQLLGKIFKVFMLLIAKKLYVLSHYCIKERQINDHIHTTLFSDPP